MKNGVVYTSSKIVKYMLDDVGYTNENILQKHIIDNSCGDGAFLVEIVQRYIKAYKKKYKNIIGVEQELVTYIHGIELSNIGYNNTIKNLNKIINLNWDILNNDAMEIKKFNGVMDFVVGNPPYVRVHHMLNNVKNKFKFATKGMTDLYIVFFEIGINMMNVNGKMIYITPNSFFNSKAGEYLRNYIVSNNLLNKIINLGHYNPFKSVTTYTSITSLQKSKKSKISYFYTYDGDITTNKFIYNNYEFFTNHIFYFNSLDNIKTYEKIQSNKSYKVIVKNGVSTNLDYFFINDEWKGKYVRDIYKISTGKYLKVIFPYDNNLKLIKLSKLSDDNIKKFNENKDKLIGRNLQNQKWYAFARTQGIQDTLKKRICVNSLIKDVDSIKLKIIKKGVVVYSGFYINYDKKDERKIINLIKNKNFVDYETSLNKPKQGKYYSFSSKELEKYLNYLL